MRTMPTRMDRFRLPLARRRSDVWPFPARVTLSPLHMPAAPSRSGDSDVLACTAEDHVVIVAEYDQERGRRGR